MEKVIIKGKGKSRLELTLAEILLIDDLRIHQVMRTDQLYQVYTEFLAEPIHAYSFKNRLRKLEEFKIIRSDTFADGVHGDRFKFYALGTVGVDLLIERGYISDDFNKNSIYKLLKKENLLHFLGGIQSAINIRCVAGIKNSFSLYSIPPSQYPYEEWIRKVPSARPINTRAKIAAVAQSERFRSDYKKSMGSWMTIVRPDWIICREQEGEKTRFLNIEFDTGSERLDTLEEKLWKYHLLAKYRPNEQHILMAVVPDKNFSKRYNAKENNKRLMKLEDIFFKEVNVERSKEVGLIVCTTTLEQVGYLGYQLLTAIYDNEE